LAFRHLEIVVRQIERVSPLVISRVDVSAGGGNWIISRFPRGQPSAA
jgi:hypothetical protein